jgi:hypothetical protein
MGDGSYGQSLVAYIDYLNTYVFNTFDAEKQVVDEKSYKYMFPNYEFLLQTVN